MCGLGVLCAHGFVQRTGGSNGGSIPDTRVVDAPVASLVVWHQRRGLVQALPGRIGIFHVAPGFLQGPGPGGHRSGALQRDRVRRGSWSYPGSFLDHRHTLWHTFRDDICKTGLGARGGCPLHGQYDPDIGGLPFSMMGMTEKKIRQCSDNLFDGVHPFAQNAKN